MHNLYAFASMHTVYCFPANTSQQSHLLPFSVLENNLEEVIFKLHVLWIRQGQISKDSGIFYFKHEVSSRVVIYLRTGVERILTGSKLTFCFLSSGPEPQGALQNVESRSLFHVPKSLERAFPTELAAASQDIENCKYARFESCLAL